METKQINMRLPVGIISAIDSIRHSKPEFRSSRSDIVIQMVLHFLDKTFFLTTDEIQELKQDLSSWPKWSRCKSLQLPISRDT